MGMIVSHRTGNPWTYLEVKRSKVKVTASKNVKALLLRSYEHYPKSYILPAQNDMVFPTTSIGFSIDIAVILSHELFMYLVYCSYS